MIDEEIFFQVDFSFFFGDGGIWKFGVKGCFKEKEWNIEVNVFEVDDVNFVDFCDNGFVNLLFFFDGCYDFGQVIDLLILRIFIWDFGFEVEKDIEEDFVDYEFSEDVFVVYVMVQVVIVDCFMLMGGFCVEQIDMDYIFFELVFDEDGEFVGIILQRGFNDSMEFLLSVNLIYEIDG